MLGGAHGKLLDADHDRLGTADVQASRWKELMHSPAAVHGRAALPVRPLR